MPKSYMARDPLAEYEGKLVKITYDTAAHNIPIRVIGRIVGHDSNFVALNPYFNCMNQELTKIVEDAGKSLAELLINRQVALNIRCIERIEELVDQDQKAKD